MTLPAFDPKGNLPVGDLFAAGAIVNALLHATLAEMKDRFVAQVSGSATRSSIWDGWMRHRSDIESFGLPYATLIDGSYITDKRDPGDVDMCVLLPADQLNALDLKQRAALAPLLNQTHCKSKYSCDVYHVPFYPVNHTRFQTTVQGLSYWTRVFGSDRKGNQKAFLLVTERGIK